ncbi:uroporphyrinogen-III C-methyltransferase [Nodularia spumigena CS-588/02]|uniref:uroporphyrinogen-III C-methyltransferase n=1 Tax=Nodularia spumigena TaxID=70799 RepID=UPI00232F4B93|nr:uroporphyrinogen-III C-methyltransferase [Nodularia spumigena]MDB9350189.1 uroporphyrinogen-III C-methyltransferase [Nodularia spumigena CS-588/01]MDB9354070.1 uroporphyrinogen-III C-methyltransferase [Nodularia spumigena CS-588/05]MDB9358994.1 uroporphyrinogen-III C-methyltransferase [Nodularia spumigena CS-588/02]MDB9366536.1 uroporphyrinogen-III C-methyltransferase [Nodularia spumigena CS-588/02A10]
MNKHKGKVYLVGAGPGNVAYLTVKAYSLLAKAEVLIYDALVDEQLLQCVSPDCLRLDVGKRGGKPSTPQTEINQLIVQHCLQGKQVVRLKSGDPFIFGRCTAEIQALQEFGCEFEVVPGISSALAAPLMAGIPLTDPVLSRCFAVLTAHEPDVLDWEALSRLETLVILMGGRHLPQIIQQLVRHGRSPSTAIAIIRWAGTPQQQIWTAELDNILEQTSGVSLSPVVIVIGEVVRLCNYLQSEKISLDQVSHAQTMLNNFSASLPLRGKTVLVTRSSGQSSQFSDRLTALGATVIEMPTLEIVPPSSWDGLDQAIANLIDFDWLILTSSNGVDYFFARLIAQGKDIRALAGVKIAVVGEKTAQSLHKYHLQPDFIPPNFVADSLVENLPEALQGKKVLFPRVESGGREVLVKELTVKGAEVVEVAAYQSRCPDSIPESAKLALQNRTVDIITFASSKTVKFFCQLISEIFSHNSDITYALEKICIASIGPQTSKTCHALLGRVTIEAEEYTLDGLTEALIKWVENSEVNRHLRQRM